MARRNKQKHVEIDFDLREIEVPHGIFQIQLVEETLATKRDIDVVTTSKHARYNLLFQPRNNKKHTMFITSLDVTTDIKEEQVG